MTGELNVGVEELDRRLRGGDAQALAELFSRERERLWRIVQFRLAEPLRGRLDPDDVLQEAFLAASQRPSIMPRVRLPRPSFGCA